MRSCIDELAALLRVSGQPLIYVGPDDLIGVHQFDAIVNSNYKQVQYLMVHSRSVRCK
jgi:hypothetical protein